MIQRMDDSVMTVSTCVKKVHVARKKVVVLNARHVGC